MDFYAVDQGLRDLLAIYLPGEVLDRLTPHYQRLGQLAGGRLDELAALPTDILRCCILETGSAVTLTGSSITPPIARWSR